MPTRREKIESMLALDPSDVFLRYSLALELQGEQDHARSQELLRGLMADPAPYVPAFFMLAQQLVQLDQVSQARQVLRDGIEQARQQGNAHAAGEMSELLASLGARPE